MQRKLIENPGSCKDVPRMVYTQYIPTERNMSDNLLLKFKAKDSKFGVTRETLKALSEEMDLSETMVIHLAISRFAKEVLPNYEADEGPLTAAEHAKIFREVRKTHRRGRVVESLFTNVPIGEKLGADNKIRPTARRR